MEKDNLHENLMIKMLEGTASKAEVSQFQKWINLSTENEREYKDFQKIWAAVPDAKLLEKLDVEADLAALKEKATTPKINSNRIISINFFRRIAAVLLPLIIALTGLYFYFNQTDPKAPIVLNDGTKVWLYKDAKLDYPKTFEGNNRLVKLIGEAFFEVAENKNKPFIIEAGATNIKVLGTSFNVRSSNQETNVVVNTGKVSLSPKNDTQNGIELTKGEKGTYTEGNLIETINKDINYRSWQNGVFEFDGTKPVSEVIDQLTKYYGPLNIDIKNNKECLLEANFEKEALSTVIEVLKNSCGLEQ